MDGADGERYRVDVRWTERTRSSGEEMDGADERSSSKFDCSICLRLLHAPSTLPCGHSFCRACLRQCLEHSLKCPECRTDVPFDAADPQVSIALADALAQMYPRETAARLAEMPAASSPSSSGPAGVPSFPLFVLEPLLPGQVMQLHVFEPRYIRLTDRALSEPRLNRAFGMVGASSRTSSGLNTHGVEARILEHTLLGNGCYLLRVQGMRRFRILRTWELDGYRNAAVSWAADNPLRDDDGTFSIESAILASELRGLLKEWMREVQVGRWERHAGQIERLIGELGPLPSADEPEKLGLWGAACINPLPPLGVAPEIRTQALEATEPIFRLRLVLAATESSYCSYLKRQSEWHPRRWRGALYDWALCMYPPVFFCLVFFALTRYLTPNTFAALYNPAMRGMRAYVHALAPDGSSQQAEDASLPPGVLDLGGMSQSSTPIELNAPAHPLSAWLENMTMADKLSWVFSLVNWGVL